MALSKPALSILGPVENLDNVVAQAYTHIHPLLVLTLLYTRFPNVVADPVDELLWLTPTIAALQSVYMMLCLPPSKGSRQDPPAQSKDRHPAKRRGNPTSKNASPSLPSRIVPAILSLLLTLMIGTPALTMLMVLHGAPIASHYAHTALAALHVGLLFVAPLIYVHGTSNAAWLDILSLSAPIDTLVGGAIGTCVGAWVGAVPIPLDWDRDWQRWPVTVLAGAYGGWALGRLLGGTVLKGGKVRLAD